MAIERVTFLEARAHSFRTALLQVEYQPVISRKLSQDRSSCWRVICSRARAHTHLASHRQDEELVLPPPRTISFLIRNPVLIPAVQRRLHSSRRAPHLAAANNNEKVSRGQRRYDRQNFRRKTEAKNCLSRSAGATLGAAPRRHLVNDVELTQPNSGNYSSG